MLDNDVCDTACNTQACIYDNWSCVKPTQTCAEECANTKLGDGSCDYPCNIAACGFDQGDCGVCSAGCTYAEFSNGSCDAACNNEACAYDNYDCVRTRQLCAPGCTQALLTNDQCDSACNVKACNFDSKLCVGSRQTCTEGCDWIDFGDGICDAKCDKANCERDGGDCVIIIQGCAEGCDKTMIGDGTCQSACYNEACNWDKTDCSSQNCSPKCTPTLQFNAQCDQECYSLPCNYDEGLCFCAIGCFPDLLGDSTCDSACDNEACNLDGQDCVSTTQGSASQCIAGVLGDGTCDALNDTSACGFDNLDCVSATQGYCASQCLYSMLGDGVCDAACNTSDCKNDFGDCCRSSCSGKEGTCDASCLHPDCGYDPTCPDQFLRDTAYFYQLLFGDFDFEHGMDTCYSHDSSCTESKLRKFYDWTATDLSECTSEFCLLQYGITPYCSLGCDRCVIYYGIEFCLECTDEFFMQYLTHACVTACEAGYNPHPKFPELCWPSPQSPSLIGGSSSSGSSLKYFISTTQRGTFYYSDLARALVEILDSYAVIYLTDAITELKPLSGAVRSSSLTITTNLCSLNLNSNCLNQKSVIRVMSPAVRLDITWRQLTFEKVDIDGYYSLDNSCTEDACSYCPYSYSEDGVYIDDRFNSYSSRQNWGQGCEASQPFIDGSARQYDQGCSNTALTMKDVAVTNFRQQFKAFVFIRGSVRMTDVTFSNIQSNDGSPFIVQDNIYEMCATTQFTVFEYIGGKVELLNNGYEYRDDLIQSGFIKLNRAKTVLIKNVEFTSNFAIKSYKVNNASFNQHILSFTNINKSMTVESCTFKSNVVTGLLIYVDFREYNLYEASINNKDKILDQTARYHLSIKNCSFIDNTAAGLIRVLISTEMINVLLQGLKIEGGVAGESLIEIPNAVVPSATDINGSYEIHIFPYPKGRQGVRILPRFSRVSAITINNSSWTDYAFKFVNLVDLTIDKIRIAESRSFTGDINTFTANALMQNPKVYLSQPVDFGYSSAPCLAGISVQGTYGLSLSRIELSDMKCQGCAGLVANQIFKGVTVKDFKAVRVESNSTQSALLSITEIEGTVTLSGINADTVTNLSGSGVLYSRLTSLTFTDSIFKNIKASLSPGLYLPSMKSIVVSNVVFQSLESLNGLGAGIQASFDARLDVFFSLKSSKFMDCRALASKGGGVALTISTNPLAFLLDDCEFTSNHASSGGSSLYIESTVVFTANSKISNSKFSKNRDVSQGTLSINLSSTLSIEGCEFYDNSSTEDVLFVALSKTVSVLSLTNSKLYSNTSNSALNVRGSGKDSRLTLSSCQLYRNSAVSTVLLEKCTVTGDTLSLSGNDGPLTMLTAFSSLINSSFTQNSNTRQSGAVELFDSSSFACNKCTFTDNSAKSAGAIRVDSNSVITLLDCNISGNLATKTGSALYLINSRVNNLVENSSITRNSVEQASTIVLIESQLTIKNSLFSDNLGPSLPGIGAQRSDLFIESSNFASQKSTDAVFFDLQASSTGTFTKTNFRYGKSVNGGAVGKVQSSSAVFVGCSFDNIDSGLGSAIEASSSPVTIRDLTATNITSSVQGALLQMTSNQLVLSSSVVSEFNQTAISVTGMESVLISDCIFERGTAPAETVLKAVNFNKVTISASVFRNNQATTQVAALSLKVLSTWKTNSSLEVSNTTFMNNTAPSMGSLYADVKTVLIANSTFFNNSALSDSAGALQLDCIEHAPCNFSVTSNIFSSNSAGLKGGAVYWTKQQPIFLNNSFYNNSAVYGPDVASFGIKMKSQDLAQAKLSKVAGDSYTDIASGQRLPQPIVIALVDHTGQVVKTDNSSTASIFPADTANVTVTGNSKVTAVEGVYSFTDVKISAQPGVSIKALFSSDALASLTSDDSGYSTESLSVDMQIRECKAGEAYVGKDCVQCIAGTYSLNPTQPCTNCPSGAACLGGSLILPDSGYWRPSKYTDSIFACPNSAACLGSPHIMPSLTGVCDVGYRGNKCQACDNGYARSSVNKCAECSGKVGAAFKLIGIIGIVVVVCAVLVRSSILTAYKATDKFSIYLKIFTNYLQLILLTTQLELQWPSFVYQLFSIQSNAGTPTDQFLTVDCYLGDSSDNAYKDLYFDKLKVIALIPVLFSLAATAFWAVHFAVRRDKGVFRKQWVATLVVLFFLIHPNILRSNFSYFSCTEIQSGEFWLNENLDIRCFDHKHNSFALAVVLPVLVIWGLLVPLLVLLYLSRRHRELSELNTKLRFGFLYNGFKQSKFYWEFVIIFRKVVIICIVVFIGNQSIPVQALTLVLLLLNFLVLQFLTRP
jgi:hypothetical protein